MGQYYKPVIIRDDKIETLSSYDYDNGTKLMEHSYLRNTFTEVVVKRLLNKRARLAWVGDYAEPNDVDNELAEKFIELRFKDTAYDIKPKHFKMENSYGLCFINHSKKQFFYMDEYVRLVYDLQNGFIIHPLPLLTAIGNGKGGGDYRGACQDLVGTWACDKIEVRGWFDNKMYPDYENIVLKLKFHED